MSGYTGRNHDAALNPGLSGRKKHIDLNVLNRDKDQVGLIVKQSGNTSMTRGPELKTAVKGQLCLKTEFEE